MKNSLLLLNALFWSVLSFQSASSVRNDSLAADALEMMEVVFVGNYNQQEIKAALDSAFALYSVSITENNYMRTSDALVALRKEIGPSEMDILRCAIAANSDQTVSGLDQLRSMFAFCVVMLENE